jgi:hypothetical protein
MTKTKKPGLTPEQEELLNRPVFNKAVLDFSYAKIILPYDDGLKIADALQNAEAFKTRYGKPPKVLPLKEEDFKFSAMSEDAYKEAKMTTLLLGEDDE